MELGAFSISLTVQNLQASRDFYEKLGFEPTGGAEEQDYLIMRNDAGILIGLFHNMFQNNILTFNPGLTQDAAQLDEFTDIRDIRARLLESGIEMATDLDPEETGPASVVIADPDGNPVLIDQFFPRPGSAEG